ncbi:hypothetical protein SY2F82_33270 [Streptomyces sp. Y2F8-2]|nr:hypothetical protein SY2F82_33270 [Streptomyces sp. Y2F8-2]
MAGIALEALDDVPWERLESALECHPANDMRQALWRLALKGGAATEEDCYPPYDCLAPTASRWAPDAWPPSRPPRCRSSLPSPVIRTGAPRSRSSSCW